jgi:outer membrane protein
MSMRHAWLAGCALVLAAGSAGAQTQSTTGQIRPAQAGTSQANQLQVGQNAAGVTTRTLQDALAETYATNAALQAGRAQLRSVDENVPQALAGWRPTVVMSGTAGYGGGLIKQYSGLAGAVFGNSYTNTPQGRDIKTGQMTVTQPIYTGGHTRAAVNHAENQVMGQRATLLATEQQILYNAVQAFVNVIQNQELLALNINNEQVLQRQLQATNDRFRVGEITKTDVAQAEAALAGATAQRQTAEGNLNTARATYTQVIGEVPGTLIKPQPIKLPTKTRAQSIELAAANNPNVVSALFAEAAAKDAVDVAFSALMPQLSVQGVAGQYVNQSTPRTYNPAGQVVASLTVPLYQGGSEYSAVRQARQTEQQARKTLDDQRRTVIQNASQAWDTLIAARATADSTRAQVSANAVALEGVEREALVGSRTTLDVLNAQQALLNSQVTLVQNLATVVISSYALVSTVGRMTAHDLALPVAYYDETAYYNAVRDAWFGTGDAATNQPSR